MLLSYKNSFNAGDLITMLPGMQKLYRETGKKAVIYQKIDVLADYDHRTPHPVKNSNGKQVCMNEGLFYLIKPLIEAQEYVSGFYIWHGENVDFDLEATRTKNPEVMRGGLIHQWPMLTIPELQCDLSIPWLNVEPIVSNSVFINFTGRYRMQGIHYLFLSEHQEDVIFLGLPEEHLKFCNQWGVDIKHKPVKNFLELARLIAGGRFFLGNQSFCWHLADAMKKKRILEVSHEFPNTFPTGANGAAFISQKALEYHFNKLLKETE